MNVQSLPTSTTCSPSGYSGVFMKHSHATMPMSLEPAMRLASARFSEPSASSTSSSARNMSPGTSPWPSTSARNARHCMIIAFSIRPRKS